MDKKSYLFERKYTDQKSKKPYTKKSEYWKKILGENIFSFLENNSSLPLYLQEEPYEVNREECLQNWWEVGQTEKHTFQYTKEYPGILYKEFYQTIIGKNIEALKTLLKGKEEYYSTDIYQSFEEFLARSIEKICLRTLIVEMHICKNNKKLEGNNSGEEYRYYCENFLTDSEYIKGIFDKYPVLERCVWEKAKYLTDYFYHIVCWYIEDYETISDKLLNMNNSKVTKINRIYGNQGDSHNYGRQVMRIGLDTGENLILKPRTMQNEQCYFQLLRWFEENLDKKQYYYPIISCEDHSWCAVVNYKECLSEEQLKKYYKRIGIQLLLTYLLGTTDVHFENLIAHGEYPVLIDLECLFPITYSSDIQSISSEIYNRLSNSVLATGILPVYHWNKHGKGINSGAINLSNGQECPFKMPVVVFPGTSDMRIEYRAPEIKFTNNAATINGRFIPPSLYKKEIEDGFQMAYNAVLKRKAEFRKYLQQISGNTSRVVLEDTQKYSMLLSASYHPSLLMDGVERELFLYSVWKGNEKKPADIVHDEVKSLLAGDIPYFYRKANGKDIYRNNNACITDYFHMAVSEILAERIKKISIEDLQWQTLLIEISLEFSSINRDKCINKLYHVNQYKPHQISDTYNVDTLITKLFEQAIWNKNEVSWMQLQIMSKGNYSWQLKPMNYYLYNGLSGMLLLACKIDEVLATDSSGSMFHTLRNMIFSYTDCGCKSITELISKNTGGYEGESSIVYTYLTLYRWTNEKIYLEYAEKHAEIVDKLLVGDVNYDFLSGNAGAVQVLVTLYKLNANQKYLKMAEKAMEVLRIKLEKLSRDTEECKEELNNLAGVAHGYSGMMVAAASLWDLTQDRQYEKIVENLWKTENCLFNPTINNWADMRITDSDKQGDTVAWCHGAGGILLSRLYCYRIFRNADWKERLGKDILRAYEKLKQYCRRDSWCLCHGNLGNLCILQTIERNLNIEIFNESVTLLPQEEYNPGLMDGYGGIILSFLCKDEILRLLMLN